MDKKGYFYTIISLGFILFFLSIIFFYQQSYGKKIESTHRKIAAEKLYYSIENLKSDYKNVLSASGVRATTILIGRILNSSENFSDYKMVPCNNLLYNINGSQAAIAEMVLCGTLYGEKIPEMENNTLLNWTEKVMKLYEDIEKIEIKNLTFVLYDAWNITTISVFGLKMKDKSNISFFDGNVTVISSISVEGLEDPLYYLKTKEFDLVRKFKKCEEFETANGTIISNWINEKCYHESNETYKSPSFFDRLEGSINLSEKYLNQSKNYFQNSYIGLESFVDLYDFWIHNISLDFEDNITKKSWIDYLYWQNISGDCKVNSTPNYAINATHNITFRIDQMHILKYNVSNAEC